ncbi:MAG: cation diffusion facilitator family transporter [Candidatus Omnitrophica bacterium]|nr:cation diffusion facilitator family transporter [Candidatus Omnitrophota bacterium]
MGKGSQIKRVLILTLFLNFAVALAKFIFGQKIGSTSMVADSFHSFSDSASNIIGLLGVWIAYLPLDKDHPYGHKKYETLTSIGIALLLFLACFNIISLSLKRVISPITPNIDIVSVSVMLLTLAINLGVMIYEHREGKRLASDILISDSMHTRADIFTSLSVLFSFLAVKMGMVMLDPIIALMISIFIGKVAVEIILEASKVLCDTTVVEAKRIEQICLEVPGVIKCHKIRTRGRADDVHMDLHVLINKRTRFADAHDLSSFIEQKIKKEIAGVSDVVIHMEPCDENCE